MARKKKIGINYNRVLKLSDYAHFNAKNRKTWEVQMALNTLRAQGGTCPDALILGVGAGHERTIFELANEKDARMVFATDLYLDSGSWVGTAPNNFLKSFDDFAPDGLAYDRSRIVAQHIDMRNLTFPDNYFDAIFSSGSIEHLPTYEDMAQASAEMGRVLKPGGILSLSTEWKIKGKGWSWDNVRLFDEERLMQYIVEPSGCQMIDTFDDSFDGRDEDCWSLIDIIRHNLHPENEFYLKSPLGHMFTSVHIALRKPAQEKVVVAEEEVGNE